MIRQGSLLKEGDQVAALINEYNKLPNLVSKETLIRSNATYYPICSGDRVVASVALSRLNYFICEVKHLVVIPELRGSGIAQYLVRAATKASAAPYLVASIRSDNIGSLKVFQKCGFELLTMAEVIDHNTVLVGRPR